MLYTNHSQAELDCSRLIDLVGPTASSMAGQMVAVVHPDCRLPMVEGLPNLSDTRNEFARLFGGRRRNVDVIRPDSHIGCRATLDIPGVIADYAKLIVRPATGS